MSDADSVDVGVKHRLQFVWFGWSTVGVEPVARFLV